MHGRGVSGPHPDAALRIPPILLVGCGRMGGAMLAGWRERGLERAVIVDPAPPALPRPGPDLVVVGEADAVAADFVPSAVVFAVKPQQAAETLPRYRRFAGHAVFVSIMAGRTIGGIRELLDGGAAIVRAMPNTPAAIGQGVTVACPGPGVTAAQQELAESLLKPTGTVAWVSDEGLLDAVTAVSGSGPAYVFLLAELLEQAAIEQGIPADLARLLARGTVSGSGALLAASPEASDALRRAVTSPGGTTEAALGVLMASDAWPALLRHAVDAASRRSRELAG